MDGLLLTGGLRLRGNRRSRPRSPRCWSATRWPTARSTSTGSCGSTFRGWTGRSRPTCTCGTSRRWSRVTCSIGSSGWSWPVRRATARRSTPAPARELGARLLRVVRLTVPIADIEQRLASDPTTGRRDDLRVPPRSGCPTRPAWASRTWSCRQPRPAAAPRRGDRRVAGVARLTSPASAQLSDQARPNQRRMRLGAELHLVGGQRVDGPS